MQMLLRRPSAQQIDALAAQLAGARSCQDELLTGLALDQQMHDLQQGGQFLHFINDDLGFVPVALHQFGQPFRPGGQESQGLRIEQVNPQRLGIVMGGPERLARATRTKQEKVIAARRENSRDKCHSEAQNGGTAANFKGIQCQRWLSQRVRGVPKLEPTVAEEFLPDR
jgi:hypothetical protein